MKQKLTVFLLMIYCCLLFSGIQSVSAAIGGTCGENLTWTLDDAGTLTISGTGDMSSWDYSSIPWYSNRSDIKKVVIGNSVTTIGDYAFSRCTSLTSVTIPDSVTSIGYRAFADCYSLTGIIVDGNNVNYSSIDGTLFDKNHATLIRYAPGKAEDTYVIPDSVTTICNDAFGSCSNLTSITISEGINSIGSYAFGGCIGLTDITIPDGVTTIGDSAFHFCISLTGITIPDSVTTIGDRAFSYCYGFTNITVPNSVTIIGDEAFADCHSLTGITIPDSVTTIGDYTFNGCRNLTSIIIPDSITSIGNGTFAGCYCLTNITIPDSVTIIGDKAFFSCRNLTSIIIPDSVTTIGESAFDKCYGLNSITISDSVTSIGHAAFYKCTSLTDVYYNGTEKDWNAISIGGYNTSLTDVTRHYVVSVTLLNPDGTEYVKWTQLPGTALDVDKIPAMEGSSLSVYKDSAMTQEYDLDTMINEDTVLYVKVMAGIKAKLSDDKKQLQVQPFGILEGSKILVAFYQNGKFQQVQPETYEGEALFFPVNQAYTDIKIMAWQNFDTLKSLCVPEELPIQ